MGANPVPLRESVRFGEFELDLRAFQLLRSGRNLKLERIPMELLLLMAQRPGELVTREEIAERIWGKGVCLDTDNSINGAIRKLRLALKDDADQPRYIQTIPGKGYRFIAPLAEPALRLAANPVLEPIAVAAPLSPRTSWLTLAAVGLAVLVLVGVAYFWLRPPAVAAPAGRTMLAVLPFENLTGDPAQDYFSDGLTEEMIARLGSLNPQRLSVIARTSVMRYKAGRQPLDQVARELGVQYILEGSVRRDAEKVRVTAQLVQVRDQTTLWSRHFDREVRSLLAIQDNIAQAVAAEIHLALAEGPSAEQRSLSPVAFEAYDLYLRGRYSWARRNAKALQEAVAYFEKAIAADPSFARAYAGLAEAYALMGGYSVTPSQRPYISKGRAAALKALELDPRSAEAHTALALIAQTFDWDWKVAEREYRQAIALDPNYATAHHWYAECLALQGRFDEAFAEIERARQLDPLSLIIATDHGAILYFAREYDRAIEQLSGVLRVEADFPRAHVLSMAYQQKGMVAEALADLDNWDKVDDTPWIDSFRAYVHGRSGNLEEGRKALGRLEKLHRTDPIDPAVFYVAYTGLGMNDEALRWVEEGLAQHSPSLTALKVDPLYDPLRNDLRFQQVLRRIRLQ